MGRDLEKGEKEERFGNAQKDNNESSTLIKSVNEILNKENGRRNLGRTRGFYFVNGEPRIVIGPHWPFFVCLLTINITIAIILFNFLWRKVHWGIYLIGLVIAVTQLVSYVMTALINPGIPKREYENNTLCYPVNSINLRKCKDCNLVINTLERTFHCYDCEVCVEGYDHHCPWTSKCIGKGNIKQFYIFIISTMLLLCYLIFSTSMISPVAVQF